MSICAPAVIASLQRDFGIYGIIGKGTYGVVLAVENKQTKSAEAIKIIAPVPKQRLVSTSAIREIAALCSIRVDNVVRAKGIVAFDNGYVAIRMSLYDGTLRTLLNLHSRYYMTLSSVRYIFSEVVLGLASMMERKGIIHRDLKPENILLRNKGRQVAVADWGMCKSGAHIVSYTDVPYTREVVTKWYGPPEALAGQGKYSVAIDVWSLGVILAEMLLGEPLFADADSRQKFILSSVFDVLGTPVSDADKEFFKTTCGIDTSTLTAKPCMLESRLGSRPFVTPELISFLKRLLAYTNRPSIADLAASDYVKKATYPQCGIAFASDMELFAETAPVATSPTCVYRMVDVIPDIEDVWVRLQHVFCWNLDLFSTSDLVRAWDCFKTSGSVLECTYVWMSSMCMSTLLSPPDDEIDALNMLVAILTIVTSTTCSFRNRRNTLYVQSIVPGITEQQLFDVEREIILQTKGLVPTVPLWFKGLMSDESRSGACVHVCSVHDSVDILLAKVQ